MRRYCVAIDLLVVGYEDESQESRRWMVGKDSGQWILNICRDLRCSRRWEHEAAGSCSGEALVSCNQKVLTANLAARAGGPMGSHELMPVVV